MSIDSDHKSSADLQRDAEVQRARVESTIAQIQERLSPGQLVDEFLAYTKGGGGEFIGNMQKAVTANPLPVALLGVSLAWLMAKPSKSEPLPKPERYRSDRHWDDSINANRGYASDYDDSDYPLATITGTTIKRSKSVRDEAGKTFHEFTDEAGKSFKAMSDETGKRAGHFVDAAGNTFKGFSSATGERVEHFRDEAGNLLDEASGWALHTWQKAQEKLHDARDALHSGQGALGSKASETGDMLRDRADQLNQTILNQFKDQPLIGGALAFAVGAALAATLPHTQQEDKLMGEAADAIKAKAGDQVSDVYEQGKDKAGELYDKASEKAGALYSQAKEGIAATVDKLDAAPHAQNGTSNTF